MTCLCHCAMYSSGILHHISPNAAALSRHGNQPDAAVIQGPGGLCWLGEVAGDLGIALKYCSGDGSRRARRHIFRLEGANTCCLACMTPDYPRPHTPCCFLKDLGHDHWERPIQFPRPDHSQQARSGSIDCKLPKQDRHGEPSAWRSAPTPRRRRLLRSPHRAPRRGATPPLSEARGAERSAEDAPPWRRARGRERRTPYLHQLPPVLPRNSFFSEFQMNFFQPPSSLAFPRAMVAGQQLPRGCGETAACALGPLPLPLAPAGICAGCTRRCRCGAPSARRAAEEQERERGGRRGRRAEGGAAGWAAPSPAPIGGHAAAHGLSLVHHPLLSPLELGGSRSPQLPLPLPLGTRTGPPPPVTSAEAAGPEKVRGKDGQMVRPRHDCDAASRAVGGGRALYLYYIPRRGAAGPRPLAAKLANRRRGGAERGLGWGRGGGRGAGTKKTRWREGWAGARGRGAGRRSELAAPRSPLLAPAQRPPAPPSCGSCTCVARRPADSGAPARLY